MKNYKCIIVILIVLHTKSQNSRTWSSLFCSNESVVEPLPLAVAMPMAEACCSDKVDWNSEHNFVFINSKANANLRVTFRLHIDISTYIANLSHFWRSTGFCPPDPHDVDYKWFHSPDMKHNLAYFGAVPHAAIKQVRIHWLLDTVTISHFYHGQPVYNFTHLDDVIECLWENGLSPGFEIMGNPSSYFTDFDNKTQVYLWKDLVYQLASHYIEQYGLGYVSEWNFETWNEPRRNHFDNLTMTIPGFLNYYDATSEGLLAASPRLQFGGPGGECHDFNLRTSYCWNLLLHCQNGRNFFTGESGVRIDYISIHKKGKEPDNTKVMIEKEKTFVTLLKQHLPGLLGVPIINDEADPLVGWSRDKWWRADATYAAVVAKVIVGHQKQWFSAKARPIMFRLLSNDNGFLSYRPHFFTQRTLLARFQINTTTPAHVQFIRKPVYSVMGLLSLLGERQVDAHITSENDNMNDDFGALASVHLPDPIAKQDSWQVSILLYYSKDTQNVTGMAKLNVNITNLLPSCGKDIKYVLYRLDNAHGNPSVIWRKAGKPDTPSWKLLNEMRANEEPVRVVGPTRLEPAKHNSFKWEISLPGLLLFHACAKAMWSPDQVTGLKVENITAGQVLIIWSDSCVNTRCVKTYEVEFSTENHQVYYKRINTKDTFFTLYVFAPNDPGETDATVRGFYRVRAVDFWNRPGLYSPVFKYS